LVKFVKRGIDVVEEHDDTFHQHWKTVLDMVDIWLSQLTHEQRNSADVPELILHDLIELIRHHTQSGPRELRLVVFEADEFSPTRERMTEDKKPLFVIWTLWPRLRSLIEQIVERNEDVDLPYSEAFQSSSWS